MRIRPGGSMFLAIALLILLATSAGGSEKRLPKSDNAVVSGKKFVLPRKDDEGSGVSPRPQILRPPSASSE